MIYIFASKFSALADIADPITYGFFESKQFEHKLERFRMDVMYTYFVVPFDDIRKSISHCARNIDGFDSFKRFLF